MAYISEGKFSFIKIIFQAAMITLLTFFISRFFIVDVLSLSIFSADEETIDYEFSDFYEAVAARRSVSRLSADISIVSVDMLSRNEIGEVVEKVAACNPRAIILDVIFFYPSENDSSLFQALNTPENLVLPLIITEDGDVIESYFYDSMNKPLTGAVNLAASSNRNLIRKFKKSFSEGDREVESVDMEALRLADEEKYKLLKQRREETEYINFTSLEFLEISGEELLYDDSSKAYSDEIKGKIVIIGNINDPSDYHFTPAGILSGSHIHAYILQTMIDGKYVQTAGNLPDWVLAISICFVFLFFGCFIKEMEIKGDSLCLRIIQIILFVILVYIGLKEYMGNKNYLNLMPAITMVIFGTLSMDIWYGLKALLSRFHKSS